MALIKEEHMAIDDDWEEDAEDADIIRIRIPKPMAAIHDIQESTPMQRVLLVYPVSMQDLSQPAMLDVIKRCCEMRTSYVQQRDATTDAMSWVGFISLHFLTNSGALQARQLLQGLHDNVTIRLLELNENENKVTEQWRHQSAGSQLRMLETVALVKNLPASTTLEGLTALFPTAEHVVLPMTKKPDGSVGHLRGHAYLMFTDADTMQMCLSKCDKQPVELSGRTLVVFKYQAPPNVPQGLLKLRRRYRHMCQAESIRKALEEGQLKPKVAKKVKYLLKRCEYFVERDTQVRVSLGLRTPSLEEMKLMPSIRDSYDPAQQWFLQPDADVAAGEFHTSTSTTGATTAEQTSPRPQAPVNPFMALQAMALAGMSQPGQQAMGGGGPMNPAMGGMWGGFNPMAMLAGLAASSMMGQQAMGAMPMGCGRQTPGPERVLNKRQRKNAAKAKAAAAANNGQTGVGPAGDVASHTDSEPMMKKSCQSEDDFTSDNWADENGVAATGDAAAPSVKTLKNRQRRMKAKEKKQQQQINVQTSPKQQAQSAQYQQPQAAGYQQPQAAQYQQPQATQYQQPAQFQQPQQVYQQPQQYQAGTEWSGGAMGGVEQLDQTQMMLMNLANMFNGQQQPQSWGMQSSGGWQPQHGVQTHCTGPYRAGRGQSQSSRRTWKK